MKSKQIFIISLIVVSSLCIVLMGAFLLWAANPLGPMPEALAAMQNSQSIRVEQDPWIVFRPARMKDTGFIIYPGGRVDYRSYAPAALAISSQGYLVVITPMPLNLAVFDINAADTVIKAFPEVKHWAIGGHSLGGAMAAQFIAGNSTQVEGLILWASYPASNNDLSMLPIRVSSISGSVDGFSTPDKILASELLLPSDTAWVVIAGGNHSQFGWYGFQAGDNPATITRSEQTQQVVDATVNLLVSLGN
jgi:pimeloyl-ACP methyl ester carboxylesterase